MLCRAFTVAQAVLQLALGWRFAADLPHCMLLQTVVLVAFNKVSGWLAGGWVGTTFPSMVIAANKDAFTANSWLRWAPVVEFSAAQAPCGSSRRRRRAFYIGHKKIFHNRALAWLPPALWPPAPRRRSVPRSTSVGT